MYNCEIVGEKLFFYYCMVEDSKDFDLYLDSINEKYDVYEKITCISIETASVVSLAKNFLKFVRVKEIIFNGPRFFYLNCTNIPKSVEKIDATEQTNLPESFLFGSETLTNLTEIRLCGRPYVDGRDFPEYYDPEYSLEPLENPTPIADLPRLERIIIVCESFQVNEFAVFNANDYKTLITNLSLLKNVKYRIFNVNPNAEGLFWTIVINLIPIT